MDSSVRIVEIKEDITSRNNAGAKALGERLAAAGVCYVNIMSAPGSGKTTLLLRLLPALAKDYRVGVIEADIDSDVDAAAVAQAGVKVIQMHTGGACHITWQMSRDALDALGVEGLDVVVLENIGNLVCPAEFDTGAAVDLVLVSVPEGDDKPLKYPLMFRRATAVAVTKLDTAPVFDFSQERFRENLALRNPEAPIFFTSAATGEGIAPLAEYLREKIKAVKQRH